MENIRPSPVQAEIDVEPLQTLLGARRTLAEPAPPPGPLPATFSSLPYDILYEISLHLDPNTSHTPFEAPSVTRKRRELGRRLALVSRNTRLIGTECVWRRVAVGFHCNPQLLRQLAEQDGSAEHVRHLHVFCSPKNAVHAAEANLAAVLPLLGKLEALVVSSTPQVVEYLLQGAQAAPHIANVRYLQLAASSGSSPTYPSQLLQYLLLFTGVQTLDLDLRVPADATFALPTLLGMAPLRPKTVFLSFDEVALAAFPALSTFTSHFLHLITLPLLRSFSLYSPYTDRALFSSLFNAASLGTLAIALEVGPLKARLPDLVALLPALARLENLSVFVLPPISAPLILAPTDPLRPRLLAALPSSLKSVELDLDFMYPPGEEADDYARVPSLDVFDYIVDKTGKGSSLELWRTVEWEEAMGLRRECSAVKEMKEGRAVWTFHG